MLVRSTLLHLLLLFVTQSYCGTHIRGDTDLPKSNGLLLCISLSAVSSWVSPTNRTIFCVTGDINCNKEDLTIMSNVTEDDDNQSRDVLLLILDCDKVGRRGAKENKERWYFGLCVNEYNIWN